VVVDNFNVGGSFGRPAETQTELIIDPDALLALAVPCQRLESVARWRPQKLQSIRGVQLSQFAGCYIRHIREALTLAGFEQCQRIRAPEAFYHVIMA